jgi:hypothetical protein
LGAELMRRFLKFAAAVVVGLAIFAGASVDFHGDSRYAVAEKKLWAWRIIPEFQLWKPNCAAGLVRSGGWPCGGGAGGAATSYTMSGPGSGNIDQATSNYTVQQNGTGTTIVTPADASHGGIFSPSSVTLNDQTPATFTYTPLQSASNPGATFNISATNNQSLSNPSPIPFTVANILNGYPSFSGGGGSGWQDSDTTHVVSGTTDPFGGSTASTVTEDTASSLHYIYQLIATTSGQTYRYSVWFKQGTGTRNAVVWFTESTYANYLYVIFNPSTCALVTSVTVGTAAIAATATYPGSGGWCLAQVRGSVGAFTSVLPFVAMASGTNVSYTGDGSSTLDIYGPVFQ